MEKDGAVQSAVSQVVAQAAEWLGGRRWFGDKSRGITAIRPEVGCPVELDDGQLFLVTAQIAFADGGAATYFMPVFATTTPSELPPIGEVDAGGKPWYFLDALDVAAFRTWFLHMVASSTHIDDGSRSWQWRTFDDGTQRLKSAVNEPSHLMSGEQSNTSLRYGEKVIVKVFRKLQAGQNPDVEIGSFLQTRTDFAHSPALFGTAELHDVDLWSIAAIQAFQPNDGDGWTWLLRQMRSDGTELEQSTLNAIDLLGQRTGELHLALTSDTESAAFRPERFDPATLTAEANLMQQELDLTLDLLAANLGTAMNFSASRERLSREIRALALLAETVRIRVHGDYHLGQVLRTRDNDFSILDFEGEPARPISQRRQKSAALRDVAGMLRSLDYAMAFVEHQEQLSESESQRRRAWTASLRHAFLTGYLRRAAEATVPLVPRRQDDFERSLRALEVHKALYEVRYELDNRPEWVSIPLTALGLTV